eukprot:tig00020961_g16763.t1
MKSCVPRGARLLSATHTCSGSKPSIGADLSRLLIYRLISPTGPLRELQLRRTNPAANSAFARSSSSRCPSRGRAVIAARPPAPQLSAHPPGTRVRPGSQLESKAQELHKARLSSVNPAVPSLVPAAASTDKPSAPSEQDGSHGSARGIDQVTLRLLPFVVLGRTELAESRRVPKRRVTLALLLRWTAGERAARLGLSPEQLARFEASALGLAAGGVPEGALFQLPAEAFLAEPADLRAALDAFLSPGGPLPDAHGPALAAFLRSRFPPALPTAGTDRER